MADEKLSWERLQRTMVIPLVLGGGGLFGVSGHILQNELKHEIQRRIELQAKVDRIQQKLSAELEKHRERPGHSGMAERISRIEVEIRYLRRHGRGD